MVIARRVRLDTHLGLQGDLRALGGGEAQGPGEASFAVVGACPARVGEAVDVGVVEEIDANLAGGGVKLPDLSVAYTGDAHHAGRDGGGVSPRRAEGNPLHGF